MHKVGYCEYNVGHIGGISSYDLNNFREEEVPLLKKIILKSCEGINLLIANKDEECRRLFSKTIV